MGQNPRELSDEQLIGRLREDEKNVRAAKPVEDNAPVDLEPVGDEEGTPAGPGIP
jgi:hypothetical protein